MWLLVISHTFYSKWKMIVEFVILMSPFLTNLMLFSIRIQRVYFLLFSSSFSIVTRLPLYTLSIVDSKYISMSVIATVATTYDIYLYFENQLTLYSPFLSALTVSPAPLDIEHTVLLTPYSSVPVGSISIESFLSCYIYSSIQIWLLWSIR